VREFATSVGARWIVAETVAGAAPESPDQRAELSGRYETVASPPHTVVLLLILTAITILGYYSLHRAGGVQLTNHLRFYLPTLVWEWLVFGYIYWGVRRHGKTFDDVAGERWKNAREFFRDVGIALVAWVVAGLILNLTARLLHATAFLETAKRMAPRGVVEDIVWIPLALTAGICEETIFRGYFQRQFSAWFRSRPAGVLLSAILFGAGHIYQGVRPAMVIVVFGLIFGILAEWRRNIRPGMILHAWQDGFAGFAVRLVK
jgi:uncharacterized protein